ncbi:MAG: helix-turn-helix transcriptional regulator [Bryobacterales bacterium]
MKNKQIADALCITTGTVKVHLMHIFEKTGVRTASTAMDGRKIRGFPPTWRTMLLGAESEASAR